MLKTILFFCRAVACGLVLLLFCGAAPKPVAPRSEVAVVRPVTACVAAERNYAASLSKHLVRWLQAGGVKADLVDDQALEQSLAGRRIAFLVMSTNPSEAQLAALARFRARGGKLVVFFSQSAALAAQMGVKMGVYKRPQTTGGFAKMVLVANAFTPRADAPGAAPAGAPAVIEQSSSNIRTALPVMGRSRAIAMWTDGAGRSTGDAAILASPAGWWVTHVFLGDGDEEAKKTFALAAVGSVCPHLWNPAAWAKRRQTEKAQVRAYAAQQAARPGEIHATWDHSGLGLYPGDWPRTMRLLASHGITDVFVNVAGPGFAHYASRTLPLSPAAQKNGDQLAACLAAARTVGVRVHAWVICFNATRATPARLADLTRRGWRLKNAKGADLEYLDPSNPDLQRTMLDVVSEISRNYAVSGVQLDFVRWYEGPNVAESTPAVMARYRHEGGRPGRRAFLDWRAKKISEFVANARARCRANRPSAWFTTAVFGKYPACVDSVGQDWESWLDLGLVDYAVPMNYVEDPAQYAALMAQQGRTRAHARKIISGIGVTANESRLGPVQVIGQINAARRAGLAGVAFFDLDYVLANDVLPVLRLGVLK